MSRLKPVAVFVFATAIIVLGSEVGEQLAIPDDASVAPREDTQFVWPKSTHSK